MEKRLKRIEIILNGFSILTLIYSQFGDKIKAVTDQNVDTILQYYLNKKSIVFEARNLSLYELEERRKAS
tara:strand:- start:64809 stop:65018 length:210 start_codon:yes stop_codon:yes gene_type:complete